MSGERGTCGFCGVGDGWLGDGDDGSQMLHGAVRTGQPPNANYAMHPNAIDQQVQWCGRCVRGLVHKYQRYDDTNLHAALVSARVRLELDGPRWTQWNHEDMAALVAAGHQPDDVAIHGEKLSLQREISDMENETFRRVGLDLTERGWRPWSGSLTGGSRTSSRSRTGVPASTSVTSRSSTTRTDTTTLAWRSPRSLHGTGRVSRKGGCVTHSPVGAGPMVTLPVSTWGDDDPRAVPTVAARLARHARVSAVVGHLGSGRVEAVPSLPEGGGEVTVHPASNPSEDPELPETPDDPDIDARAERDAELGLLAGIATIVEAYEQRHGCSLGVQVELENGRQVEWNGEWFA